MTFVTRLTLQSGDRAALESVVSEIRTDVERKGAELKGPHTFPPGEFRVPLHKSLEDDGEFEPWNYTVYSREIEIVGHDQVARQITQRTFPEGVHVSAEVEQIHPMGKGRSS